MGLRERALEAWAEDEKNLKEAQERTDVGLFNRARDHFLETFGIEAEVTKRTSHGVEVGADGMVFLYNLMTRAYWLWGECLKCGKPCWSSSAIYNLGELGGMLEDFRPGPHTCGTPEAAEETVVETLRKVLHEILEGGE